MTALIAVPDVPPVVPPERPTIEIVEVRKASPPPPEPEIQPKHETPDPPPVIPAQLVEPAEGWASITHAKAEPGSFVDPTPTLTHADGDAVPLVRVPPRYPERALQRGVEGRVLVGFTIDRAGNVRRPEVLAAEPPDVFDRAAIEAVSQWKYNPRVRNGEAIERPGMKISIPFRLGEQERAAR